MTDTESG